MRGTWGTGARGETTDERSLLHEISADDYDALLNVRLIGGLGMYQPHAPLIASEQGRTVVIGNGWIMATPLAAGGDVVGVMYNDSALSRTPMDENKQALAAVFCAVLAVIVVTRRGAIAWQPLPRTSGQSPLVRRVLGALQDELPITGDKLARELGVSAGYLARSFKREMAISLVDYRNRLRLERFFDVVQRQGNCVTLLEAALEAGFGSYAQFHRVYRKFQGGPPRGFPSSAAGGTRESTTELNQRTTEPLSRSRPAER